MTSANDVWQAVKDIARRYADSRTRPTGEDAIAQVRMLFAGARLDPPPEDDIITMYAQELLERYDRFVDEQDSATP